MSIFSTERSPLTGRDTVASDKFDLLAERRQFKRRLVAAPVLATPLSMDQMPLGQPLEMLMTDASQEGAALVSRVSVDAHFLLLDFKPSGAATRLMVRVVRTGRKGPNYLMAGRFVHLPPSSQ